MMLGEVTRLNHMKRFILVLLFFLAAPLLAQQPPDIRFHSVPDFLKLPPDLHLGEATVILDGRIPHVLLLELFTEHGAGTLITAA